ncbi:MAG: type IV pilus biogenesis/stability protein PilW, partial [Burkholderiaceae bacterium]|nr:type IV pilus biogenesis/stability protein PilW [Burkholderiaceae bacterium]
MNRPLALLGALTLLLGFSLAGCASGGGGNATTASGLDLTTTSDEPDARRRARLRVELATGYFEQGKTTVALDEIKQALVAEPNYSPAYNLRGLTYLR